MPYPDLRHTWFQDPVKLEDALGRILPIPSEYNYSKVEAIVKDQFKAGPGRQRVLQGDYELFDAKNSNHMISNSEWTGLLPGMNIKMAIIVEQPFSEVECCPMPRCISRNFRAMQGGGNVW